MELVQPFVSSFGAVLIPIPAAAATLHPSVNHWWSASMAKFGTNGPGCFHKKVVATAVDQSVENGHYKGQELLKEVKPTNVLDYQQHQLRGRR